MKNKKIKILAILAVLIIAIDVGLWFSGNASSDDVTKTKDGATIVTVKTGSIEEVVTAQGKLEPKDYVDVGAQVSGRILKLSKLIGDNVVTGDLIAEIDPQTYQTRIASSEAQIKTLSAQRSERLADIKQAKQNLDRANTLIAGDAIARQDLEDAQTALDVANAQLKSINAQIEQAKSTLEEAKVNLGYTKIYAPMDGTITTQPIKEGQTINASQTAPTISQVANLDTMTSRAQVAEADIGKLKPDMDVYFTTLGSGKRKWQGTIRQILPSPEVVNDVVLYNVLVDVDNKDRALMTGMTTQMFFVVGSAKDVPIIPANALGKHLEDQDNDTGDAYEVQVMDGKEPIKKPIHVGMMTRTEVEVTEGLQIGDRVLIRAPTTEETGNSGGGRRNIGPRL
ncbi:MAG TPA: efflux RND transporter periplasmic adaptor subunit [Alphaproteobacteria bacterium]